MMNRSKKYVGKCQVSTTTITDSIENQSLPTLPIKARIKWGLGANNPKSQGQPTVITTAAKGTGNLSEEASLRSDTSKLSEHSKLENLQNYVYLAAQDTRNIYKADAQEYKRLELSFEECDTEGIESIDLPRLQPMETEFIKLVTKDDVEAVKKFLKANPGLNINCVNFQGISALNIAVQNQSEAMVDILIGQPNIEIEDTILHAVRDNNIKILTKLLEALKNISPGLEFAGATHSTDYAQHVTPLLLAAQSGHYEVVALLIARGHTISRPHVPNCLCSDCKKSLASDDPLRASTARLSVYQAISSPAYLVQVSADPVLSAFNLSSELEANAASYRHLGAAYLQLRDYVSAFAVELIGCCRSSEEVEMILKQTTGTRGKRHFALPRLLMAVNCKQKEFVAHPNTQQLLEYYWIGNWHSWRRMSTYMKILTILTRVFITPIIFLICMITPRCSLVKHWQIPLNKLITHTTAYFVFLAIVFFISNQDKRHQKRGPPNTDGYSLVVPQISDVVATAKDCLVRDQLLCGGAEGPLILFVCGYTWSAIRMNIVQGPRRYFSVLWNWVEIIMITLFGITFLLWRKAAYEIENDKPGYARKYWNQYDPTLLAEGTFCLATIFAYFRLMFLCQLNYHLGPLQVSLGKMTIDIYKYIIVFTIIISAFAAGLARFYQYYDGMVYEDSFGMKIVQVASFTSLMDTLKTLFWALFCMAPLESADVVLENSYDPRNSTRLVDNHHSYTERIGYFCFGCFEVISVIIVLNMLIATMSNTFQRVNDNVAIEWTFGRTEVYLDYMSQTTLPSPYNLLPTTFGLVDLAEWLRIKLHSSAGERAGCSPLCCCYIERDVEASIQKEFPVLMSVLVQRYFRDKDVTLRDSNAQALRREIASLRIALERP